MIYRYFLPEIKQPVKKKKAKRRSNVANTKNLYADVIEIYPQTGSQYRTYATLHEMYNMYKVGVTLKYPQKQLTKINLLFRKLRQSGILRNRKKWLTQ